MYACTCTFITRSVFCTGSEFGNERKRLQRTVEFLKQREQKEIEAAVKAYMDWITLGGASLHSLSSASASASASPLALITHCPLRGYYRADRYSLTFASIDDWRTSFASFRLVECAMCIISARLLIWTFVRLASPHSGY